MAVEAQDVDDIWAEMQQEQRIGKKAASKVSCISHLQRERAPQKTKGQKKSLDASLAWMQKWAAPLKVQSEVGFTGAGVAGPGSEELADIRMLEPPATLIDALGDIPSDTPETFLAYLQRDINCLGEDNMGVRLQSMQKLERILVGRIDSLSTDIIDGAADALLKPLLKRMKDKSEKCRELAVRILMSLVENVSDLSLLLAYIFPSLVSRLGSEDLEGIAHLPEVMRPEPQQKPTELAHPVEESEEVRLELARFVTSLLGRCSQTQILCYIDEASGLIRAQAMDPYHEVKNMACEAMISFCHNNSEMLLHFAEPLARSLTSCLTHNHAKLRIAALRALTATLWCGVWKHNFEILQLLMAWQDPNKVPIQAFYGSVTNVNYMSMLSFDRHPAVRRFWYETLAYWLLRIPDKVDHEPYIFPYLLTGLCDENEDIALEVFWLIEKCGEFYEKQEEEQFRKTRQYGFDYGWTYQGRAFVQFPLQAIWEAGGQFGSVRRTAALGPDFMGDLALREHKSRDQMVPEGPAVDLGEAVPLPARDYAWPELRELGVYRVLPRPRLGSRCWVRTHTRRYIKATFNDVVDFRDCTSLNAGRLLCMSLAYTEEGVTEWLQPMAAALRKFYSGRAWAASDKQVMGTYDTVCKLLGVFLDPTSYWQQFQDALSQDSILDLDQRIASVRILAMCIEGSVTALQSVSPPDPTLQMGRLQAMIPELIAAMHSSDLLLSPTEESRAALWNLLFSFLEPLREFLSSSQVSQLLFVALALAAQPPAEAGVERVYAAPERVLNAGGEELIDSEKLQRALASLDQEQQEPHRDTGSSQGFSLDSLDDDDPAPAPAVDEGVDPRMVHRALFERAFPEVLAHVDDSFQVFRSVLYVTPLVVLVANTSAVLDKLKEFCRPTSSQSTRVAGQSLCVNIALRCAKLCESAPSSAHANEARTLIWKLFRMMGRSQLGGMTTQHLSYAVLLVGLTTWRQFFLSSDTDPRTALFPPGGEETPIPLKWLISLLVDQELYKRFHGALEHAETTITGKEKEEFVVKKSGHIRQEADRRAAVVRVLAASTVLLALRRMLRDGRPIPWAAGTGTGSPHELLLKVASLFSNAEPTMEPPFVKPTPSYMVLYAAEIIRVLLHRTARPSSVPANFQLLDDAARAIHCVSAPASAPSLPDGLDAEQREALAGAFVGALIDLNLSLPPDPNAKHAPATIASSGGGSAQIILGWDEALDAAPGFDVSEPPAQVQAAPRSPTGIPSEVFRILDQSLDCMGWNAALAMYLLGLDLYVVCKDGFQQFIVKSKRRKEQARVLIATDLLERSRKTLEKSTSRKTLENSAA